MTSAQVDPPVQQWLVVLAGPVSHTHVAVSLTAALADTVRQVGHAIAIAVTDDLQPRLHIKPLDEASATDVARLAHATTTRLARAAARARA